MEFLEGFMEYRKSPSALSDEIKQRFCLTGSTSLSVTVNNEIFNFKPGGLLTKLPVTYEVVLVCIWTTSFVPWNIWIFLYFFMWISFNVLHENNCFFLWCFELLSVVIIRQFVLFFVVSSIQNSTVPTYEIKLCKNCLAFLFAHIEIEKQFCSLSSAS